MAVLVERLKGLESARGRRRRQTRRNMRERNKMRGGPWNMREESLMIL